MKIIASIVGMLMATVLIDPAAANWYITTPQNIQLDTATGDVYFASTAANPVAGGCINRDFYIIRSTRNAKTVLGILLTARALNKNVIVYLDETSTASLCDASASRPQPANVMLDN